MDRKSLLVNSGMPLLVGASGIEAGADHLVEVGGDLHRLRDEVTEAVSLECQQLRIGRPREPSPTVADRA